MIGFAVTRSTHGMACSGCREAADSAVTMARATGSVGATYDNNGEHAATVRRVEDGACGDDCVHV